MRRECERICLHDMHGDSPGSRLDCLKLSIKEQRESFSELLWIFLGHFGRKMKEAEGLIGTPGVAC